MFLFQDHRDLIIMEICLIQARLSQNTDDIMRQEENLNSRARQAITFIEVSTSEHMKRRVQDFKGKYLNLIVEGKINDGLFHRFD
jgi:hypothetical protein